MDQNTRIFLLIAVIYALYVLAPFRRRPAFMSPFDAFLNNRIRYNTKISRKEFTMVDSFLIENYHYYKHLSDSGRARFINRLVHILRSKKFVAKEDLSITPEMKVMVSAALAQVSFGLEKYLFDSIHTIWLYPRSFYIEEIGKELKGGTTPNGFIAFSWEDLEQGYHIPNDAYNLGLHEAAHALKIQLDQQTEHSDERFAFYLKEWLKISESEYQRIRQGFPSYLREYAGENPQEFFAVCIEHFFEAPEAFWEHLPDIYNHMCVLLNQNPLNMKGDYELTREYMKKVNTDPSRVRMPMIVKD